MTDRMNSKANQAIARYASPVVARVTGRLTIHEDDSLEFNPYDHTDEKLYTEVLAENKNGSIKCNSKTVVLRAIASMSCGDLAHELLNITHTLINPILGKNLEAIALPDSVEHIGDTSHAGVYIDKDNAIVQMKIPFNEVKPEIQKIWEIATPEQRKYMNPYWDPGDILQVELPAICSLLRKAKQKDEDNKRTINKNVKRKKANKNA